MLEKRTRCLAAVLILTVISGLGLGRVGSRLKEGGADSRVRVRIRARVDLRQHHLVITTAYGTATSGVCGGHFLPQNERIYRFHTVCSQGKCSGMLRVYVWICMH